MNTTKSHIDYSAFVDEKAARLFEYTRPTFSPEDQERVREAYLFAKEAHKSQKRKSGEPYIIHPIAVATIIAHDLELGANMVIAGLLHDVVEDTEYTIEDIRKRFGDDVAFLVGVVTKNKKQDSGKSKQIENFRQILASVHFDVRALLIKVADRLHNMRTLDSMRADKQMKIAGETDYFYAPLANRIGLYQVKTELENLSFRYRCPRDFNLMEEKIADYKELTAPAITAFTDKINRIMQENGIEAHTEVRYRAPYSIWRKMLTSGSDFDHVDGKHYVRIVFPESDKVREKATSLLIYSLLTDYFKEKPGSVMNYIDAPKENGYQSFHVKLLCKNGMWQEVHISSEKMIRLSRLGCAALGTDAPSFQWLDKFRSILKEVANDDIKMDFMEGVTSSFYNDDIMVFTPKGRVVILPKNATAIDFAYEIHTDLGRHAKYARINGKLCSVKTVLHRGDVVEIDSAPDAHPEPDWGDYAHTYKSQRDIRNYLASRPALEYARCAVCHPLPGDEVIGFRDYGGQITLHKRDCPAAVRLASEQGDSIVEATFPEDPNFLYPVRIQIRGIDRFHLLSDLINCITEGEKLNMKRLATESTDNIFISTIDFDIHSADELESAIAAIRAIDSVDEVRRIDIE